MTIGVHDKDLSTADAEYLVSSNRGPSDFGKLHSFMESVVTSTRIVASDYFQPKGSILFSEIR